METSAKYTPISCNFYDYLEAWATKRNLVDIQYRDLEGQVQETSTYIDDLINQKGEEFMVLANGLKIRLDYLLSVNGIPLRLSC